MEVNLSFKKCSFDTNKKQGSYPKLLDKADICTVLYKYNAH